MTVDPLLQDNGESTFIQENKFDAEWNPDYIFSGFNARAVFSDFDGDPILKIDQIERFKRRLNREIGEEGTDWIIDINPYTDQEELYLKDTSSILMWRIQNAEKVDKLFSVVYEHQE